MTSIRENNIPSHFKQRERWLLWDSSHQTPRQPHWRGDFNVSWNDPDDWHPFEDAVAAAAERDSWGIGFVIQPDDPVYMIDVDGPFNRNGQLREWCPQFDLFEAANAYMEWSPSGKPTEKDPASGLHIPVRGEVPEWWTDCEVDPDLHQGVDVLTNKFCTVTGSVFEGVGDAITDTDPRPWLLKVYKNIRGEWPFEADEPEGDGCGPDLERDDLEEALTHLDPDMAHREWVKIGYAVHAWDDSATGRQVFEQWSRSGSKWDDAAERTVDWIWSNAEQGGESASKVTVGTLLHKAKKNGYQPPGGGAEGEAVARTKKLRDLLDTAEAVDEPDHDLLTSIWRLLAEVSDSAFADLEERAADVLDKSPNRLQQHRELARHADDHGPIQVADGRTWYIQFGSKGAYREEVLNFELNVESILRVDDREVIEAQLRRPNGTTDSIQFEPRDMQKKQRFKDNVLAGKFGLTFDPPGPGAEAALNALNEYIGNLDIPVRHGTHHIGLHGDEWVTPVGTLRADGWANTPETVYVDREVALERTIALPTDTAEYDTDELEQILTTLPETRDPARMVAVLGWFYAAPLRPLIFDDWGAGAFNHLNITGDTGSGKTTTLRYLWRCFGVESDPFAVTDTKFAMISALAASNALPVWYDEYKPSEIQDYRLDQFHDLYRKAATGGVETRGRADQTTEEYHTHAPVVVSGEEQIRRPAERRRSVMVAFREDVTDKGTETRAAFKALVGEGRIEDGELVLPDDAPDPTNHALAYYRWILDAKASEVREMWESARETVWQCRQRWDADHDLDDMEVQGLQTVAFGWRLMRAFARAHDIDPAVLPDESALDAALRHVAGEIAPDGERKSHMDRFVELLGRAAAAGYVERDEHFVVVREGSPAEEELRVNLNRTYDALSKYARDHGLDTQELLSNADDYRKRFKEASEADGGYVIRYSHPMPIGRCVGIRTRPATTSLELNREAFGLESFDLGEPETEASGDNTPAAADGGDQKGVPDDAEGYKPDARRLAKWVGDTKKTLPKGRVIAIATERLDDTDPDRAESLIEVACRDGLLIETGDGYRGSV